MASRPCGEVYVKASPSMCCRHGKLASFFYMMRIATAISVSCKRDITSQNIAQLQHTHTSQYQAEGWVPQLSSSSSHSPSGSVSPSSCMDPSGPLLSTLLRSLFSSSSCAIVSGFGVPWWQEWSPAVSTSTENPAKHLEQS